MELKQVYEFTNLGVTQALGKSDILKEDLSNIVEVGDEVFNAKSRPWLTISAKSSLSIVRIVLTPLLF